MEVKLRRAGFSLDSGAARIDDAETIHQCKPGDVCNLDSSTLTSSRKETAMSQRFFPVFGWSTAVLLVAALVVTPARAETPKEKMQGTWDAIHAQVGGQEAPGELLKAIHMTIEGEKLTLVEGDKTYVVHFALSPAAKPSAADFYKDSNMKEKVWHGIYDFDGKNLKMCWGAASEERPSKFAGNPHNEHRYFIFVKKK
jgi:uncharacterized protein (TIGR03067 family)